MAFFSFHAFHFLLFLFAQHITRFQKKQNYAIILKGGGIGHCYDDDDDDDRGGGVGLELMALLTARRRSIDL